MGKLRLLDHGEEHEREAGERAEGLPLPELVRDIKREVLEGLIHALRLEAEGLPVTAERFGRERAAAWEGGGLNYYEEVKKFEVALIAWALEQTKGHQTAAAKLLGLSVSTLNMKVKQFNIEIVRPTPLRHA